MGTRIPSRTPVSILSLMSLDQGRSRTSWNTNLPLCKNRFVTEFTINTIWANITAKAKKVYGFNFTGTVCYFHVKFNVSVVHYQSLRDLGSYRFDYKPIFLSSLTCKHLRQDPIWLTLILETT